MAERESADTDEVSAGNASESTDGANAPDRPLAGAGLDRMAASARCAAEFLKSLGHEQRLMVLCHLASGERSVGGLEEALGARQAAVSQQLVRLRHEGLVTARRDGRTIHYRLADGRSQRMIGLLYELFCRTD